MSQKKYYDEYAFRQIGKDHQLNIPENLLITPITPERINNYEYVMGESFFDQFEGVVGEKGWSMFLGFLLHKYPHMNKQLFKLQNKEFGCFNDLDDGEFDEIGYCNNIKDDIEAWEVIYKDICEYINLSTYSLKRCNYIIICTLNYYKWNIDGIDEQILKQLKQ